MIYYKEIDIIDYDTIVSKSLAFTKQNEKIFNRTLNASLYWFNFYEYSKAVPEVVESFGKLGLKCIDACVYVMYNPAHTSLHKDHTTRLARINLPLLNCENTYTNFYSNVIFEAWMNPDTRNISYPAVNTDYVLETRVEMKKTTVVRISEAHKVDMPAGNPVPRITLSLQFDKDPVFLLDNN
jgi:hypothetical protein